MQKKHMKSILFFFGVVVIFFVLGVLLLRFIANRSPSIVGGGYDASLKEKEKNFFEEKK